MVPSSGWEGISTVLPSLALSAGVMATVARYIRAEMIEALSSDYIISKSKREFIHAYYLDKKCTYTNYYNYCTNVSDSNWYVNREYLWCSRLGDQFVRSITTNDFSVIMATTILFSTLFIVSIFIVDILYGIIDPRIRAGGKK